MQQSPAEGSRRTSLTALTALGLIVLLAAAGAIGASTYGSWSYGMPGPGLFPLIAAGLTMGFGVLAFLGEWRAPRQPRDDDESQAGGNGRRLLIYIAVLFVWALTFAALGFALSTALSLLLILRGAEQLSWLASAGMTVSAVAVSWFLFEKLLQVPLPHSVWLPI